MTSTNHETIQAFLAACQVFLAADQVVTAENAHRFYGKNSIAYQAEVAGALLPTTQAEVVHIVTLANAHKVALYPISTGHNWGYGGATPHGDHAVIIDLHRMCRIISVDPELGIATLEPGVTTGQLFEYLNTHKLNYMVPATGAGPTNSLIGNALERGFGLVPTSDHFQGIMSLTAILADGRVYCSALANNSASDIGHLYKWGVGPYLDGIFSQGNVGVVTQATIALAPRPQAAMAFAVELNGYYPDEAVNYIRDINQRYGKNLSPISLMNKNRLLSSSPFENPKRVYDWKVFGVIYGDKAVIRAIKRGIGKCRRSCFIRPRTVDLNQLMLLGNLCAKLPRFLTSLRLLQRLQYTKVFGEYCLGNPTDAFVQHVAYGGKGIAPLNPDQDDIGVMWYAPLVPMRAVNVRQFLDMANSILKTHQFEFNITLTSFGAHCFDGTLLLKYDRTNPADCKRAKQCYEDLFVAGSKLGFVPYRVGLQGMKLLVDAQTPFWQVARDVKHALDPNGILSPGRYNLN